MAKKILVVDDEPDVLSYLVTFLNDNGFDTVEGKNGKEALEMAKSEKPDLITLDISMPEQSGVRAFRDLQETTETANIPVIVITGVTSEFKKFLLSRKQVDPPVAYFEKPIDREEVLAEIKKILKV